MVICRPTSLSKSLHNNDAVMLTSAAILLCRSINPCIVRTYLVMSEIFFVVPHVGSDAKMTICCYDL